MATIPSAAADPGRTLGVEEEFLLVDPGSRRSVNRATAVLARAGKEPEPSPGLRIHPEFQESQVEAATGVCTGLAELAGQVASGRGLLHAAARAEGVRLVSSGTPVLDSPVRLSDDRRYARIGEAYAHQATGYQACGCHVHVGVPDRETAVAVVNHLRPWLPTLLALSANSPFDRGCDSGYASWRVLEMAKFPVAGVPPWFGSAASYDAGVDQLVASGVLADRRTTFWLARPSPCWPTVEIRSADALGCVWETALQAALARALVRTALADLAAGREAARLSGHLASAALWSSARYGLSGPAVHPSHGRQVRAGALAGELLARITPALEDTGDLALVTGALARLGISGTGTDRQRHTAARYGPEAVVDMLAAQTCEPAPG